MVFVVDRREITRMITCANLDVKRLASPHSKQLDMPSWPSDTRNRKWF